jgi:hypothetical protein
MRRNLIVLSVNDSQLLTDMSSETPPISFFRAIIVCRRERAVVAMAIAIAPYTLMVFSLKGHGIKKLSAQSCG